LAHTKSREDDQAHMNELLKTTSEKLIIEKTKMERKVRLSKGSERSGLRNVFCPI